MTLESNFGSQVINKFCSPVDWSFTHDYLAEYYYFSNVLDSILIFPVGDSAETVYTYTPPPRGIVSDKQCCCHAQTVLCYLSINLKFEMEMLCND